MPARSIFDLALLVYPHSYSLLQYIGSSQFKPSCEALAILDRCCANKPKFSSFTGFPQYRNSIKQDLPTYITTTIYKHNRERPESQQNRWGNMKAGGVSEGEDVVRWPFIDNVSWACACGELSIQANFGASMVSYSMSSSTCWVNTLEVQDRDHNRQHVWTMVNAWNGRAVEQQWRRSWPEHLIEVQKGIFMLCTAKK